MCILGMCFHLKNTYLAFLCRNIYQFNHARLGPLNTVNLFKPAPIERAQREFSIGAGYSKFTAFKGPPKDVIKLVNIAIKNSQQIVVCTDI